MLLLVLWVGVNCVNSGSVGVSGGAVVGIGIGVGGVSFVVIVIVSV